MNKLIGLIIVVSALIGAATAWRFPFSWGQNRASNQLEASEETTAVQPANRTQVQPANQSNQRTAQAPNNAQRTAQAPQTVGQAGTGTTPPAPAENAPADDAEPITGLW
ncbi:MAG TPA: hypothetical protein DCY91_07985 [Cyanobacteria bacterium UBA11370]|nr:hypothetical protein [Cyanobacteria bacterium UBA11370]